MKKGKTVTKFKNKWTLPARIINSKRAIEKFIFQQIFVYTSAIDLVARNRHLLMNKIVQYGNENVCQHRCYISLDIVSRYGAQFSSDWDQNPTQNVDLFL